MTSNGKSHGAVKEYLTSFGGVTSVKISKYEEFITAEAPIATWENMFETVFFTVGKKLSKGNVKNVMTKRDMMAVRTLQYKLPKPLRGHVTTVLNTVQAPLFEKKKNRSLSADDAIDLTADVSYDSTKNEVSDSNSGDVATTPGDLQKGGGGGGGNRPDKGSEKGPRSNSLGLGLTYPLLLNQVYNIKSNSGKGKDNHDYEE